MLSSLTLLLSAAFAAAAAPAGPKSQLVVGPCDAGEHMQFETVECDIPLKNTGDEPIIISNARGASGADWIEAGTTIAPHAAAYLKTRITLHESLGYTKHSFRFDTSEPGVLAQRGASVTVFTSTLLDQGNPEIDLGVVGIDQLPVMKPLVVSSREVRDFRVLGVESKPDYVSVAIENDGHSVRIGLTKGAPLGLRRERIVLKVNGERQSRIAVVLSANIEGDVVVDSNPFLLGLMRTNGKNEFMIRLSSRSGKEFKTGDVSVSGVKGAVKTLPCVPAKSGCELVRLDVANDQVQGRISGIVSVELPDLKQVLKVHVIGMLVAPELQVHNLNEEMRKRQEANGEGAISEAPAAEDKVDIARSIKQEVEVASEPPAPGNGPLLRWVVNNQANVHGFIIWRADSAEGPLLRINEALISADPAGSGAYQWRDNSAESGKTYWYVIGFVDKTGQKTDLSSRQMAKAK